MKQKTFGTIALSIATLIALSACGGSSGGDDAVDNNGGTTESEQNLDTNTLSSYNALYFIKNFNSEYISAVSSDMSSEQGFVQSEGADTTCSALGYEYVSVFSEDGITVEHYTKGESICTEADYSGNNMLGGGSSFTMAWNFSDAADGESDDEEDSGDQLDNPTGNDNSGSSNDQINFQEATSIDLNNLSGTAMISSYNLSNQNNEMLFTLGSNGTATVQYVLDARAYWQSMGYDYSISNDTITFTRTQSTLDLGEHPSPDLITVSASSSSVRAHTMLSVEIDNQTTSYEVYSAFDESLSGL